MKLSFWKRETVSRADHEAAMAKLAKANVDLQEALDDKKEDIFIMARRIAEVTWERNDARAEAEANKVDAEAHRERLRRDREYHQRRRQRVAA